MNCMLIVTIQECKELFHVMVPTKTVVCGYCEHMVIKSMTSFFYEMPCTGSICNLYNYTYFQISGAIELCILSLSNQ